MKPSSPVALVMDADRAVVRMVAAVLERDGFSVIPATGPDEALCECAKSGMRIAVAVLDAGSLRVGGLDMTTPLRVRFPDIHIVYMAQTPTYMAQTPTAREAAASVLRKPFRLGELLASVAGGKPC
jgi:DNA-binding response OmpR family regulator